MVERERGREVDKRRVGLKGGSGSVRSEGRLEGGSRSER